MFELRINKFDHKFNGKSVMVTHGHLDSAYFTRVNGLKLRRPVAVIILAKGSAVELMDILEADELAVVEVR